jgi:predicted small secreted protein
MKRLVILMLLSLLSVTTLTACNTVHGLGLDIKKAGEAISGAFKK